MTDRKFEKTMEELNEDGIGYSFEAAVGNIRCFIYDPAYDNNKDFEIAASIIEDELLGIRERLRGKKFKDGEGWLYCNGGACDCHLLCATIESMLCTGCPEEDTCCKKDGEISMNHERHNKMLSCLSERLEE